MPFLKRIPKKKAINAYENMKETSKLNDLKMKKNIFFLLFLGMGLLACHTKETKENTDPNALSSSLVNIPATASGDTTQKKMPKIIFDADTFHFGKINQGDQVTHEFGFSNKGNAPLLISAAEASCGCTVAEYPEKPIAPGGAGRIKVIFNSTGKSGIQHKTVTIISNTMPASKILSFTGEVVKK